jgi:hypothetical protein
MDTIYIEEIDSDDEGPPTPPPDGREQEEDESEQMVLESGQGDPEGVCSLLDPGCMVETKAPESVGEGYVMAWRHLQLADKFRPLPRGGHAAASLTETTMVIFGGADRSPQPFNDTFVLDVTGHAWNKIDAADPPQPRSGHSVAVISDRVFVFGGQDYATGCLLEDLYVLALDAKEPRG